MGCGGSKCDPHVDSLPARLRPLLLRRLDEIRRRSKICVSSNPLVADHSKKVLLKDGVISDDDNSIHRHDSLKLRPNFDQSEKKPPADVVNVDGLDYKAANPEPSTPRSPKVAPEPEPLPEKLLKQINNKKPDQELCITVDASVAGDRFRDDILYPGSPSFRFYVTESESILTDKDEDYDLLVDHSDKEDDDSDKKSYTDLSFVDVDSINSDSTTTKKKKRRVHRLRKVIPMGKTLLNVRSCYKPSCGRHPDDASLLRQKIHHSI